MLKIFIASKIKLILLCDFCQKISLFILRRNHLLNPILLRVISNLTLKFKKFYLKPQFINQCKNPLLSIFPFDNMFIHG